MNNNLDINLIFRPVEYIVSFAWSFCNCHNFNVELGLNFCKFRDMYTWFTRKYCNAFFIVSQAFMYFFSPHKSQVMISQVRVIGMFFYVIGFFFTCFKQNCVVLCSLQKKQSHQNLEYFLLLCYLLTFKNSGVSWLLTP